MIHRLPIPTPFRIGDVNGYLIEDDPLTLVDEQLAELARRLADIPHIRRMRVHTRLPIVIPQRVTDSLIGWLNGTRLAPIMIVHANHLQEIDDTVGASLGKLVDAGVPVLNQAVLLRGVNDTVEAQEALLRRLVELRVKPYYLHHADLARGTGHFRTTLEEGQALVRELRSRASGLCQPPYVLDLPGGHGKVPVGPGYVHAEAGETWIEDCAGRRHRYPR